MPTRCMASRSAVMPSREIAVEREPIDPRPGRSRRGAGRFLIETLRSICGRPREQQKRDRDQLPHQNVLPIAAHIRPFPVFRISPATSLRYLHAVAPSVLPGQDRENPGPQSALWPRVVQQLHDDRGQARSRAAAWAKNDTPGWLPTSRSKPPHQPFPVVQVAWRRLTQWPLANGQDK